MPPFDTAEKKAAAIAAIEALEQKKDAAGKVVKQGLTQIGTYKESISNGTYTSNPEALSESIKHLARKLKETRDGYAAGKSKQPAANATRIDLWPQLLAILEEEGTNANRSYVNTKLGRGAAAAAAAAGPGGGSSRGRSTRKNGSSGNGRGRSRSRNPFNMFNEPNVAAPGGGGGGGGSKKSLSAGLIKYQANLATLKASGMSNKNARNTLRKRKENSLGSVGSAAAAAAAPAGKARGRSRSASGSRRGAGGAAAKPYNPFNDPNLFPEGTPVPNVPNISNLLGPAAASSSSAAAAAGAKSKRPERNWNRLTKLVRAEMLAAGLKPTQAQVFRAARERKGAGGAAAAEEEEENLLIFPPKNEEEE